MTSFKTGLVSTSYNFWLYLCRHRALHHGSARKGRPSTLSQKLQNWKQKALIGVYCIRRESNPELGHGKTQCYRYTTNAHLFSQTTKVRHSKVPSLQYVAASARSSFNNPSTFYHGSCHHQPGRTTPSEEKNVPTP